MYSNKRVRDCMVPVKEYPIIYDDYTVAEAFDIMRESFHQKDGTWYGFQSLLVVNGREELVGILTLKSLLKAFKFQAMLEHLLKSDPMGLAFMPRFQNNMQVVTRDIMRPLNLITVQEDSVIFEAIVTMVKWKINSLPVMSGKELVGIVRAIDLFWSAGEFLE